MPSSDRNSMHNNAQEYTTKPTYALEHLATFKVKHESEIRNPKEKMKILIELDRSGGIWPQKMYLCFSGQWLVMLDAEMKEIENFPGSLIQEPTAFISDDPLETFNNILIFTVSGSSLGNTEMHIFQVLDVSAVHMVEDLKQLHSGSQVTIDRNKTPIVVAGKLDQMHYNTSKDQYGIMAAATLADNKTEEKSKTERDILVLNHCFEDIERFVARLQYAAEAQRELESRQNINNPHGEGLLIIRSRPPLESEFIDIFAKYKLGFNYITKLQTHIKDPKEPVQNMFTSLQTIVNVCNDIQVGTNIVSEVVNPLLRRETVNMLSSCVNTQENEFWQSLGKNWTLPKDQFKDHKGTFHPIFYDDWSPDWTVDEEVAYLAPAIKKTTSASEVAIQLCDPSHATWLARLQSRNVKIAQVHYARTANNDNELNVFQGEYLEIVDDSRNWWKARNSAGRIGYVPHTVLTTNNFEQISTHSGKETDSVSSFVFENDSNKLADSHLSTYAANTDVEKPIAAIPRSLSMPNVPIPPPPPPPIESTPPTPTCTLKRNMAAAGTIAAVTMRARNDCDADESFAAQTEIHDELKHTLMMRERRRDLEILKTPQIYIDQSSSPREVEEWLRGKGFTDDIVKKLRSVSGDELFALSPETIEDYFGQRKESRRLISQIILQKTFCRYKTARSSELQAILARARQKTGETNKIDEIF